MIKKNNQIKAKNRSECIVIMGAAVQDNGDASGAMKRRVNSALALSSLKENTWFIVTGGAGKNNFNEAETMKNLLLESNVSDDRIIIEDKSTDTLDSAINCVKILKTKNNFNNIYICSDRYHIPRCRWLFYLLGIKTNYGKVISGLIPNGILKWLFYYLRESAAFPYDTILVLRYIVSKNPMR